MTLSLCAAEVDTTLIGNPKLSMKYIDDFLFCILHNLFMYDGLNNKSVEIIEGVNFRKCFNLAGGRYHLC